MNECTVMFYFAGDNALSALIVSQIKAIKDAGFQRDTDVLIHFDCQEIGVPTRMYNVNQVRRRDPKLPPTMIGDGKDPFVRNMIDDYIDPAKINPAAGPASLALNLGATQHQERPAAEALTNFIGYCRENHPAKHYLLFLVGHGMIVGSNTFLPDERPVSAIGLPELGTILGKFTEDAKKDGSEFDLLALHSCSMSGIEVAYELQGTANYLLASQGLSYIGSWPYRQLLKKVFNTLETRNSDRISTAANTSNEDLFMPELIKSLYFLSFFCATDFGMSGYSLDLALCRLSPAGFDELRAPLQDLVVEAKLALSKDRERQLILLAHLESQSYWGEDYTDLVDFCICLSRNCDPVAQKKLKEACEKVIGLLTPSRDPLDSVVVYSHNFGSKYQYSHGLSVYFPWSEPLDDDVGAAGLRPTQTTTEAGSPTEGPLENYGEYRFSKEFGDHSWLSFLRSYFDETMRKPGEGDKERFILSAEDVPLIFNPFGSLSKPTPSFGPGDGKPTPSTGSECGCPSIKNYPTQDIVVNGRRWRVREFSASPDLADFLS